MISESHIGGRFFVISVSNPINHVLTDIFVQLFFWKKALHSMRVCVLHIPHPIPYYGRWINRYCLLHSHLFLYMGSLVSIDSV